MRTPTIWTEGSAETVMERVEPPVTRLPPAGEEIWRSGCWAKECFMKIDAMATRINQRLLTVATFPFLN
jgi:hypothetical protein